MVRPSHPLLDLLPPRPLLPMPQAVCAYPPNGHQLHCGQGTAGGGGKIHPAATAALPL
ncbi:hypothetical protein SAY87_003320 [Trapa incisa]|uniref:Uncharacterized protein n=1 Tax=Trapa incisa TaxID=236973 RepID=A0AAN7KND8_9MYRT|nr:hypothetical protein SAY87_003320 [Trapa incisa]